MKFLKAGYLAFLLCFFQSLVAQDMLSVSSLHDVSKIKLSGVNTEHRKINFEKDLLQLFVFLSPECPLCKNYSIVLNDLQSRFGKNIVINGIVPGKAYTTKELRQFVKDYKIAFPVWIDTKKELTAAAKATTTPEVVLTTDAGIIIYRGAIDDWIQELGKKKLKARELYLETAISQYLKGEPITQTRTIPKGCLINEF